LIEAPHPSNLRKKKEKNKPYVNRWLLKSLPLNFPSSLHSPPYRKKEKQKQNKTLKGKF
jgi:hypothetical protein